MSSYRIPFNRPSFVGHEQAYLLQSLANGHTSGDGSFTRRVHDLLTEELGVPKVLLTTSCTHALEMAALLLDIKPGDEVILPAFTFVSTVNAFILRGAVPVFADIRPDTLNLDERLLRDLISPRTRAIVVVHYAGVACDMNPIMQVAAENGVAVVEDNAHGLYARYHGRYLGTFGQLATQSFHETKNFSCGEGGALLINDRQYINRAEIIREKGTNRSQFFRGQVDKYTWVDVGSSFLPSDMLAAVLLGQLEMREIVQQRRQAIWDAYQLGLADWAATQGVTQPTVPAECEQAYHLYYVLLPSLAARQALIDHLKAQGILAVFHYQPLHLSPMGARYGGQVGQCPVTEAVADQLLRLPFYFTLTPSQQQTVIEAIQSFTV